MTAELYSSSECTRTERYKVPAGFSRACWQTRMNMPPGELLMSDRGVKGDAEQEPV